MTNWRRNFWRIDRRFWSPIWITSGLTIFFFGVTYVATNTVIGVVDIVFGAGLFTLGYFTAPYRPETG